MTNTRPPSHVLCQILFSDTPPTPTFDGEAYLVALTGATGAWTGMEKRVAIWNETFQQWQFWVQDGMLVSGIAGATGSATLRYLAEDDSWRRVWPMAMGSWVKSGDQTATGSFADITGWTVGIQDCGSLGGWNLDTTTGQMTWTGSRGFTETLPRVRVAAHVRLTCTVSGTPPNNVDVQLAKNGSVIAGTLRRVYMNTTALNQEATVDFNEIVTSVAEGDDFTIQVKLAAGTGTVIVEADGTSMYIEELTGFTHAE